MTYTDADLTRALRSTFLRHQAQYLIIEPQSSPAHVLAAADLGYRCGWLRKEDMARPGVWHEIRYFLTPEGKNALESSPDENPPFPILHIGPYFRKDR